MLIYFCVSLENLYLFSVGTFWIIEWELRKLRAYVYVCGEKIDKSDRKNPTFICNI